MKKDFNILNPKYKYFFKNSLGKIALECGWKAWLGRNTVSLHWVSGYTAVSIEIC
jgi:hypothetical protein